MEFASAAIGGTAVDVQLEVNINRCRATPEDW